jgi:predicted alpha/beta superfamily hydrolase
MLSADRLSLTSRPMTMFNRLLLLLCPVLLAAPSTSATMPDVVVRFRVFPPAGTPPDARVHVAGSLVALGGWNPAGFVLTRTSDSLWSGSVRIPEGTKFEFKVTLGKWATEAVYQAGVIPPNTKVTALRDTEIVLRPVQWGAPRTYAGGITGTVRYHRDLIGQGLRYPRDLVVWLPPSYADHTDRRYPVLYLQDGQNVFDPVTSFAGYDWRADEVADSLIRARAMEEIIMVGITNSHDRIREYSDTDAGHAYARLVVGIVKPFIDSLYRTKPEPANTAVMGSSMGGLISFLMTWWYPDVFSKAACISSVFDRRADRVLDMVRNDTSRRRQAMFYIDCGGSGDEGSLKPGIDEMAQLLRSKGYREGKDLLRHFEPNAAHNERSWAARLWRPMLFLFGTPASN